MIIYLLRIKDKLNEYKTTQTYNIDNIATKSVINSEKYDTYGLFLEWNHELWMTNYLGNISSALDAEHLGDLTLMSFNEMFNYTPGARETVAGWRETGYMLRCTIFVYIRDAL